MAITERQHLRRRLRLLSCWTDITTNATTNVQGPTGDATPCASTNECHGEKAGHFENAEAAARLDVSRCVQALDAFQEMWESSAAEHESAHAGSRAVPLARIILGKQLLEAGHFPDGASFCRHGLEQLTLALGADDEWVLDASVGIANALADAGQHDEAVTQYMHLLHHSKPLRTRGWSASGVGGGKSDQLPLVALGQHQGALTRFARAVARASKAAHVDNQVKKSELLCLIANAMIVLNHALDALEVLQQALVILRASGDVGGYDETDLLFMIGWLLLCLDRPEEALAPLHAALALLQERPEKMQAQEEMVRWHLGTALLRHGRRQDANVQLSRAGTFKPCCLSKLLHRRLLGVISRTGVVGGGGGVECHRLQDALLAGVACRSGGDSHDMAWDLHAFAECMALFEHHDESHFALLRALEIREASLGRARVSAARLHYTMGNALTALSRDDEALKHFENALAAPAEDCADEPEASALHLGLGRLLGKLQRHDEALTHFRQALALLSAARGEGAEEVGGVLNEVGAVLSLLGRHDEALRHLRGACAILEADRGPDDPRVAMQLQNIGYELSAMGRHEEALSTQRHVLAIRRTKLGAEHPDVTESLSCVSVALRKLGMHDQASSLQRESVGNAA